VSGKFCLDLTKEDLELWCKENGIQSYRAGQIHKWLSSGVTDTSEMNNVPAAVRAKLEENFIFGSFKVRQKLVSKIDCTTKFVYELHDGNIIETVVMRYKTGLSVCISSQAGCRMGCAFCASSKLGFGRSLTSGEMFAQVAVSQKIMGERIRSVVIMGIGEPFDNFDSVMGFVKLANDPNGLNLGARHITISTCGLVPMIDRFTELDLQVNLSISLHAPNDGIRQSLMPIAKRYSLHELMAACRRYTANTNRRLTFEYTLFGGVNDADDQAEELVRLLGKGLWHVNLIAANDVPGSPFKAPSKQRVRRFQEILESGGINATLRREMGTDIMAACGQLRRSMEKKEQ
jgi:23S rRNA (adenine2503-C2)-methyltransferase